MPRYILPRVILAAALVAAAARVCRADDPADADNQDNIPRASVPAQLSGYFQGLRSQYPNLGDNVDRYQRSFTEGFLKLKTPQFSKEDIHFVQRVSDHIFQSAARYQQILGDPSLTDSQKQQQLSSLKDSTQESQQKDNQYAQQHAGTMHADLVTAMTGSGATPGGTGATPNKGSGQSGGGEVDHDQADIRRVAQEAARSCFSPPDSNSPAGNLPSAPSLGNVLGAPNNPNSPSSMMANVGDDLLKGDLSGAMNDVNKAVDLGGGAPALAMRGGIELDQKSYSKANQDAQHALQLDPANKQAVAVAHFAGGRTDGVDSSGPAGAKGADASAMAGGGAGGGASGGSVGSAGGGGSGGRLDSGNGGLSGSIGLSGGGPAGGPGGAGLAGLSSSQAQKGAANALALGDLGGAMAFVNRGLAQNPRDPALLNLRSSIYAKQHDYKSAIADAKAGLLMDPKNAALLRSLGFAQLRDRDFQGALATANEMLELNPNDPYAYALRGHAYGSLGDRDAMMADLQRAAELDPSFAAAAAQMANKLQLPEDKDILFLFPGEEAASAAKTAEPASGRGRRFGLLVGASALGGLLLALGLLATVLAPLKEKLTSAFTRITRTGPTIGAPLEEETARPASVNGLMPGLIRGQYEISRQIGVGGMGVVYAGTDRALGRPVAIKKMRDEVRFDAREKARFVTEAKTVAALHHPNIVDIYAIAEEGDDVYLVFEYVDGRTVHDLVQASGKLEPEAAAKIVRASADALDYAHSRGVIHRDMKPSNVMLDQSGRVKVMDFGIARMAKDTALRQSNTNTVAGTPPYMAPEQEQGQVRKESDVYALAICAYEMLTGKLPFVGTGGGMLLNKINMSYVAPSGETAGLPAGLDPVFERAFQADPDKRYATPREFADALTAAMPAAVRA